MFETDIGVASLETPVSVFQHPVFGRRTALQAGAVGLLGLGSSELAGLRAGEPGQKHPARAVIFLFLSGGLGQHDSFDPKPDAPDDIRGEFQPIPTKTPGLRICEHLPLLAARSDQWAVVRSLTHKSNDHSTGHHIMLTGRSDLPAGFNPNAPKPTDHPSIAAVAGAVALVRNNLPPAVVLPEKLIHNTGRVLPGQFAGIMGRGRDPWFLDASVFEPKAYGAFPTFEFDHQQRQYTPKRLKFDLPNLSLSDDVWPERMGSRLDLLTRLDGQRRQLDAAGGHYVRTHQDAISLLLDANVRRAFDLNHTSVKDRERYGDNSFGWSALSAARLVEAGVSLVQVNLGNNETWDTHGNAFPHLKEKLFPPTDRAVSALLDDLSERGLLESTLIVMAGEFGRTPKISRLPEHYKLPGRDHWGAVQSVWLAGGGVKGGRVIGASDRIGAYPSVDPQTPENLAATIYTALGIPKTAAWQDVEGRPHFVFHGEPIAGIG